MLGVITSLLFFGSVMFHELSHSLVAKHYKIPVASITLFVFGGLARIGREPCSARQEFNIAIAGSRKYALQFTKPEPRIVVKDDHRDMASSSAVLANNSVTPPWPGENVTP
jgi:Zn-dependent protease